MQGFKLWTILMVMTGVVFSFAPIELPNIPEDILPETGERIRVSTPYAHLLGMDEKDFTDLHTWADYDMEKELPYNVITSGIYTDGFSFVNSENINTYAEAFIAQHPELVGVDWSNLVVERADFMQNKWYVTLRQHQGNTMYYDGTLELRISPNARVFYLRNELWPGEPQKSGEISLDDAVASARAFLRMPNRDFEIRDHGMRVMVRPDRGGPDDMTSFDHIYARQIELFSHEIPARFRFMVSIGGDVIRFNNGLTTVTGNMTGTMYPRNLETPTETADWPHATLYVDGSLTRTDADGNWSAGSGTGSHSFTTMMSGRWAEMLVSGSSRSSFESSFSGSTYDFGWNTSRARMDEMNVYYHVSMIHDYYKNNFCFDDMDYQMQATVGQAFDNAYFDGANITIGAGSETFENLAFFCDITQHEYTHGVTAQIYRYHGGVNEGMGLAMNEAWSDYFPCAISNEPLMGEGGLYLDGTAYMRTISNMRAYPADYEGECHYDGQILSGALWDFRGLVDDTWIADSLAHFARFGFAITFEDYLIEMLVADDDDGDITNGTNHGWDIAEAFYAHGIGPGIASIEHTPLAMTDNTETPYEIDAEINSFFDLGAADATLSYNIHYSGWVETDMTIAGDNVSGEIPPTALGNLVWYNIVVSIGDDRTLESPVGAPYAWHAFRVQADDEPPVVEHFETPIRQETRPFLFTARVTDNMGVGIARMEWSLNDETKPSRSMYYDPTAGYYYTYINDRLSHGDVIRYRFYARDNSSALLETYDPAEGWYETIVDKGFHDFFGPEEHNWSSYHVTSGYENQWHLSALDDRTGDGGYCYKCGAFGDADYVNAADGALQLDPVPVSGEVILSFWHRMDAEVDWRGAWDGGVVEVSMDYGGSWSRVAPGYGEGYNLVSNRDRSFYPDGGIRVYGGNFDWEHVEVSLGSHEGDLSVRFHFGSDLYATAEGWYIDDVEIISEYSAVEENSLSNLPEELNLTAYPNPFNSACMIDIPADFAGTLEILDTKGRTIHTAPASGTTVWTPTADVPSGVYLARLKSAEHTTSVRLIYMK